VQSEIDNIQVFDIFKVPLARSDFYIDEEEKQNILSEFYRIEHSFPMLENSYPVGSYTSFGTVDKIFDLEVLSSIKEHALKSCQELHNKIGLSGELELKKSWFSINRKYSYHEIHHHCPDIWSGVYYLQAEQGDASISFLNNNIISTNWPYRSQRSQMNDYTGSEKICRVSSGMMLLFPSYLYHNVSQQLADQERITIAFNLNLK
jgi:uncharacterized protein (TIGR02466 family)